MTWTALPERLSAFLLKGERLVGNAVRDVNGDYAYINESDDLVSVLETMRVVDDDVLSLTLVPFASDGGGNMFCLSVAAADYGFVYYLDFERDSDAENFKTLVARSFEEFLAKLETVD
jgi:cell wall assembly regulator SMI1